MLMRQLTKQFIINMIVRLSIILLLLVSCNETPRKQTVYKSDSLNIDSLERIAFNTYDGEPLKAIELYKKVADNYKTQDNNQKSGQTNLNIAGIYEEKLSNFTKALIYSKKSLEDWTLARDSMQMANLYKYIGYLEGLNKNFEKAEEDIQTAIHMYEKMNFQQGIAVSHINMSKVQIQKSNFEEAKKYYYLSKDYWRMQGNNSRIFDNNLVGIRIFQNTNQVEEVSNLIKENEFILKGEEINKFLIDKFKAITIENQ